MSEKFYRAKLGLEEVEPYTDDHGYARERCTETALINVTGDTPGDAMVQLCAHADSLYDWHSSQTEDEPAPPLTREEANERISNAFSQLSKAAQTWLRPKPLNPAKATAGQPTQPATDDEPDTVRFALSEYADPLTFDATPSWLTAALDSGDIKGVFKSEDYWYLEVKTPAGTVTAEPGDRIHRHHDGGLLVRSPEGMCKKTVPATDDEGRWTQEELDAAKASAAARHQRLKPLLDVPEVANRSTSGHMVPLAPGSVVMTSQQPAPNVVRDEIDAAIKAEIRSRPGYSHGAA